MSDILSTVKNGIGILVFVIFCGICYYLYLYWKTMYNTMFGWLTSAKDVLSGKGKCEDPNYPDKQNSLCYNPKSCPLGYKYDKGKCTAPKVLSKTAVPTTYLNYTNVKKVCPDSCEIPTCDRKRNPNYHLSNGTCYYYTPGGSIPLPGSAPKTVHDPCPAGYYDNLTQCAPEPKNLFKCPDGYTKGNVAAAAAIGGTVGVAAALPTLGVSVAVGAGVGALIASSTCYKPCETPGTQWNNIAAPTFCVPSNAKTTGPAIMAKSKPMT